MSKSAVAFNAYGMVLTLQHKLGENYLVQHESASSIPNVRCAIRVNILKTISTAQDGKPISCLLASVEMHDNEYQVTYLPGITSHQVQEIENALFSC